jgi:hypothetical protein
MRRFTCELNEHEEGVASSDTIYNTIVRMRRFTCELNEHEEGVAPTDSRLRPDQRLMEEGLWDEANTEKVGHVFLSFFLHSRTGVLQICKYFFRIRISGAVILTTGYGSDLDIFMPDEKKICRQIGTCSKSLK